MASVEWRGVAMCVALVVVVAVGAAAHADDLRGVLLCLRREYTLRATRSDELGRRCWDYVRATSCWGRCDSFEIPDWRFPYKISIHPVCIHDQKRLRRVRLRHCDPPDADDSLRLYEYLDAESCSCGLCNSSDTFCDWKGHIANHQQPQPLRP